MNHFVLPDGQPFTLYAPLGSAEPPLSSPAPLASEALEHGAYYAGKLGVRPAVARWHAKRRRFLFGEFSLGRHCVKSVAHVADSATGEGFVPLAKTDAKASYRVSDYAFETGD